MNCENQMLAQENEHCPGNILSVTFAPITPYLTRFSSPQAPGPLYDHINQPWDECSKASSSTSRNFLVAFTSQGDQ